MNTLDKPFYITTAIAYTNGYPHIGHAYEFIIADAIARYYRLLGYNVFFLTGTDEHGQKVAASAEKNNKTPKEHCDHYVDSFKNLHNRLNISYDKFIRTTDDIHIQTAQQLWIKCAENDDIYLDSYIGWYNEREECFVSDSEAESNNFMDPISGVLLKKIEEESYFFRMSKYCNKLIEYIQTHPEFIQPVVLRNNILNRLQDKDGLKDLSISRTSFNWGIPVPDGFDQKHVMYVWFDALANYISGNQNMWPAALHIIGKDIIWFHCVIWPCMLMSANMDLPKCVFAHGFVNASDGHKMSKSLNNSIDPNDILTEYSSDTLRYYLTSSITLGADINFSIPHMKMIHNTELCDILGNLIHRITTLCTKFCDGKVPDVPHMENTIFPFNINDLSYEIMNSNYNIQNVIFKTMEGIRGTNKYLTICEPWKLKGEENNLKRQQIIRTVLELVYVFTHFLEPIMPNVAKQIFDKLHTSPKKIQTLNNDFYNLIPNTQIEIGTILFTKYEEEINKDDKEKEKERAKEIQKQKQLKRRENKIINK